MHLLIELFGMTLKLVSIQALELTSKKVVVNNPEVLVFCMAVVVYVVILFLVVRNLDVIVSL